MRPRPLLVPLADALVLSAGAAGRHLLTPGGCPGPNCVTVISGPGKSENSNGESATQNPNVKETSVKVPGAASNPDPTSSGRRLLGARQHYFVPSVCITPGL